MQTNDRRDAPRSSRPAPGPPAGSRLARIGLALLSLLALAAWSVPLPQALLLAILALLLARSGWEVATTLRRQRPRRRMCSATLMCGALGAVFAITATAIVDDAEDRTAFAALAALLAVAAVAAALRARRLYARAALRLEEVRRTRRRKRTHS